MTTSYEYVVDGTNVGRYARNRGFSLEALRELVAALCAEANVSREQVIVVVDSSTKGHVRRKNSDSDVAREYDAALASQEILEAPANREPSAGDAFILKLAQRTGATIVSNDTYTSFHNDYPILSEKKVLSVRYVSGLGFIFNEVSVVPGTHSSSTNTPKRRTDASAGLRMPRQSNPTESNSYGSSRDQLPYFVDSSEPQISASESSAIRNTGDLTEGEKVAIPNTRPIMFADSDYVVIDEGGGFVRIQSIDKQTIRVERSEFVKDPRPGAWMRSPDQ